MSVNNLAESTLFSAKLTPHRSLDCNGFVVVMAIVGAVSFVAGIVFMILGAWPVTGFFGLDIVLIYWAFRLNYRAARAFEQVRITPSTMNYRKVNQHGAVTEWSFNPLWVRLERETHPEYGVTGLHLVARGQRLAIAGFLPPSEKLGFSEALLSALAAAKRGPIVV